MTITLLDGSAADTNQIDFDPGTYHFHLNGQDVTTLISRVDKIANWPNFDPTVDNARLYNESNGGTGPAAPLETSTAAIFTNQLLTDPLAAPLDALNAGVKKIFASSGVKTILFTGAAVIVLILLLKED